MSGLRVQRKRRGKANELIPCTPNPDRITVDMEGCKVQGLWKRRQSNNKTQSRAIVAAAAMPGTDPAADLPPGRIASAGPVQGRGSQTAERESAPRRQQIAAIKNAGHVATAGAVQIMCLALVVLAASVAAPKTPPNLRVKIRSGLIIHGGCQQPPVLAVRDFF